MARNTPRGISGSGSRQWTGLAAEVVGAALHNLGVAQLDSAVKELICMKLHDHKSKTRYGLCGNALKEREHLEKALEIQDIARHCVVLLQGRENVGLPA